MIIKNKNTYFLLNNCLSNSVLMLNQIVCQNFCIQICFQNKIIFYRKGQDIERILPLEEDSSISYVYRHYYGLISCCYPSHKRACNAYSL